MIGGVKPTRKDIKAKTERAANTFANDDEISRLLLASAQAQSAEQNKHGLPMLDASPVVRVSRSKSGVIPASLLRSTSGRIVKQRDVSYLQQPETARNPSRTAPIANLKAQLQHIERVLPIAVTSLSKDSNNQEKIRNVATLTQSKSTLAKELADAQVAYKQSQQQSRERREKEAVAKASREAAFRDRQRSLSAQKRELAVEDKRALSHVVDVFEAKYKRLQDRAAKIRSSLEEERASIERELPSYTSQDQLRRGITNPFSRASTVKRAVDTEQLEKINKELALAQGFQPLIAAIEQKLKRSDEELYDFAVDNAANIVELFKYTNTTGVSQQQSTGEKKLLKGIQGMDLGEEEEEDEEDRADEDVGEDEEDVPGPSGTSMDTSGGGSCKMRGGFCAKCGTPLKNGLPVIGGMVGGFNPAIIKRGGNTAASVSTKPVRGGSTRPLTAPAVTGGSTNKAVRGGNTAASIKPIRGGTGGNPKKVR